MGELFLQWEGQLYNKGRLAEKIKEQGYPLLEEDTETIILSGYEVFGPDVVKLMKGSFSFSIMDKKKEILHLYRDRLGSRALFYCMVNGMLVYGTNLSAILTYPGVKAVLDREGLCEIFGMGPARTPGKTPFKGIYELPPGTRLSYSHRGLQIVPYWKLETKSHSHNLEETLEHTRELIEGCLKEQTEGKDVAVLLSGGVDSSYLAALYKNICTKEGKALNTYSIDFEESSTHFDQNIYQPSLDKPYVERMVRALDSNHTYLWCNVDEQFDRLLPAMRRQCMPCMADIQSSFDYLCEKVGEKEKIVLTGECADEIFGGYPWFHEDELRHGFAWSQDISLREQSLIPEVAKRLKVREYVKEVYDKECSNIEYLDTETPQDCQRRRDTYLTIRFFMQTLVNRLNAATGPANLESRVPFCDPELVEYAYNIPWSMKARNGERKYILRKLALDVLPPEVALRPKSPYPKNYNPVYKEKLIKLWTELLKKDCPVFQVVDKQYIQMLMSGEEMDKPWFGQLMRSPQVLAYFYQMNAWLEEYNIEVRM